jgi:hypothetical protein
MPRACTARAGIESATCHLTVSVHAAIGTFDDRAARFTPRGRNATRPRYGTARSCFAMRIDTTIGATCHGTTRAALADRRAIRR